MALTDLHPKIGKSLNYIIKRLKNLKRDCATDTVLVWITGMKKAPWPVSTQDSNLIGESVPFRYCSTSRAAAIKEKKRRRKNCLVNITERNTW